MRHSDSSPPIPPRFVAFARRYHPSTCGSLRRTPGATSTASGLVSRCPRPGGLKDGDDEASRVPGKPTRTHATRSDPGEVAASTASETRRDDLPSNARRRPSHSMHFGAQLRGLRAPCERFAPWVTPGPRITRFRLAADLGRMGLDTHRVSNKVSKITSRHLVPLDRAFPAHALVHEPESKENRPVQRCSRPDCKRGRSTKRGHPVQDLARDRRFGFLGHRMSSAKPGANNRQTRAVDDEMNGFVGRNQMEPPRPVRDDSMNLFFRPICRRQ